MDADAARADVAEVMTSADHVLAREGTWAARDLKLQRVGACGHVISRTETLNGMGEHAVFDGFEASPSV